MIPDILFYLFLLPVMNSFMEYPLNNPENNLYTNRVLSGQRCLNSPSVMGLKIGGTASPSQQFQTYVQEDLSHSPPNPGGDFRIQSNQSRSSSDSLQIEKSPVKVSTDGSPVPKSCNLSSFRSTNYFNCNSASPYCTTLNDNNAQVASRYGLPQRVQGPEAFTSGSVYNGNIHAVSQQMYSHYGAGFVPSSSFIDNSIDIATNSSSCRLNERHSRHQNVFDSRTPGNNQCVSENNANTYEWMKIKRNPPKNCESAVD